VSFKKQAGTDRRRLQPGEHFVTPD